MPTFFWIALGLLLAWGVLIAVVATVLVKTGKLKLKKGGAPGTRSSGGFDSGSML